VADVKRNLLFENGLSGVEEWSIHTLQLRPVGPYGCLADASGVLATLDDGSTSTGDEVSISVSDRDCFKRNEHNSGADCTDSYSGT
jgi:hypothetical protein